MRHYLRYAQQEGLTDAYSCDRCILYLNTWYTSVAVERAQSVREQQDKATDDAVDPLQDYENSDNARKSVVLLGTLISNAGMGNLSVYDVSQARNHLLAILGLTNVQRAGAIINITLCEFQNRRNSSKRPDKDVILVRHHKT